MNAIVYSLFASLFIQSGSLVADDAKKQGVAGDAELKLAIESIKGVSLEEDAKAFIVAEKVIKKALASAKGEQRGRLLLNLGRVCYYTRRDVEAIGHYKEAAKLMPKDTEALISLASLCSEIGKLKESLAAWEGVMKIQPNDVLAQWNRAQTLQSLGKQAEAYQGFLTISKNDPSEWQALTKLIQLAQALGKLEQRDEFVKKLYGLRKEGKLDSLSEKVLYVRDQFTVGDKNVMALEYFELKGKRAVKYSFVFLDQKTRERSFRISFGSYESTNAIARKTMDDLKEGERLFHLDGYYPDGSHKTFEFYKGNPGYDKIKKQVISVVTKNEKPISSSSPR